MKRSALIAVFCLLFVPNLFAQTITSSFFAGDGSNQVVVKLACTSAADGTFTASTLLDLGAYDYWKQGWYLAHAYAINNASGNPDTAGTVTITDAQGQQLVGSTVGDTLTLSTSASGTAYLSVDRASFQRPVVSKLYVTIGDTQSGAATSTFTIYLVLKK